MGQKVKGGLWCDACARPVAGIKTRHRMRNLASNLFSGPAAGLLLGTSKYRDWVCSQCGGQARKRRATDR